MNPMYIQSLETRLRWLKFAVEYQRMVPPLEPTLKVMPNYQDCLTHASSYFMDRHFCRMVEHARTLTPDTLAFESTWLHSDCGFIYLEEPFHVPPIGAALKEFNELGDESVLTRYTLMRAVGWRKVPSGTRIGDNARMDAGLGFGDIIAGPGTFQFLLFMEVREDDYRFYPWSYFALRDGRLLGERVREFEEVNAAAAEGDNYLIRPEDTTLHPYHEIRWIYTAIYLMAQRLSTRVRHTTDRGTRRRAERNQQVAPPFFEVVTLRRQHQDRIADRVPEAIDWQWQWAVRGHWRNQWYPSEGIHKPVFVESYMKGPEDKPVKPPTVKLFAAVR